MINKILNKLRKLFWSPIKYARFKGVRIGDNCDIQNVNFGSEPYLIEIGNNVQITNGTKFFTHGAAWVLRKKYPNMDFFGKIKVGDNVYIGNNSLILAGVTIGSNVLVAAGSVVTKSVSEGVIVGGNPAKVIGTLSDFENNMRLFNVECKGKNYTSKKNYLLSLDESAFIKK